jgi:hypothetical protein
VPAKVPGTSRLRQVPGTVATPTPLAKVPAKVPGTSRRQAPHAAKVPGTSRRQGARHVTPRHLALPADPDIWGARGKSLTQSAWAEREGPCGVGYSSVLVGAPGRFPRASATSLPTGLPTSTKRPDGDNPPRGSPPVRPRLETRRPVHLPTQRPALLTAPFSARVRPGRCAPGHGVVPDEGQPPGAMKIRPWAVRVFPRPGICAR